MTNVGTIAPRQDSFAALEASDDPYLDRMRIALARQRDRHARGDCDFETCNLCRKDRAEVYSAKSRKLDKTASEWLRSPEARTREQEQRQLKRLCEEFKALAR